MTGPAPDRPVRPVPGARAAAAGFLPVSRSRASRRRDAGEEPGGELAAGPGNRAGRGDTLQDAGGPGRGDLLLVTAGDQAAAPRAAGRRPGPGPGPGPRCLLGPDLQHGGVVLSGHRAPGRGAQRRDRRRPGIAGIVLAGVPGLQQPHPGGQPGRHIQHLLPGGDQLPSQQVPRPGGALRRPGPPRPPRRPRQQPARDGQAPYPHPAQRLLARADRHRGVRALVRADRRSSLPPSTAASFTAPNREGPRPACLITVPALAPLPGHATARPGRLAPRHKARPPSVTGRRFGSQPAGPPERYGKPQRPRVQLGGSARGYLPGFAWSGAPVMA